MLRADDKTAIQELHALFLQAESVYDRLSVEAQEYVREFHNETGSIPHCIRWGLQGTEELLALPNAPQEGTVYTVRKRIVTETGYIPEGTEATLAHVDENALYNEVAEPFQVDFDTFVADLPEDEADGTCLDMNLASLTDYLQERP